MTRIFIVRHGQTNYNVIERYQGQLDTPLNEVGVEQAAQFKERILKSKLHIDEIWSSDLQRARATVTPIAKALSIPMRLHAGLREVDVGYFTDKSRELVKRIYEKELEALKEDRLNSAYPGGESIMEVRKRAYATVCEIADKNDGKTLLLASHGGTINLLIVETFSRLGLECPNIIIPNCSIFTFEYENGRLTLKAMETVDGERISFSDKKKENCVL